MNRQRKDVLLVESYRYLCTAYGRHYSSALRPLAGGTGVETSQPRQWFCVEVSILNIICEHY